MTLFDMRQLSKQMILTWIICTHILIFFGSILWYFIVLLFNRISQYSSFSKQLAHSPPDNHCIHKNTLIGSKTWRNKEKQAQNLCISLNKIRICLAQVKIFTFYSFDFSTWLKIFFFILLRGAVIFELASAFGIFFF